MTDLADRVFTVEEAAKVLRISSRSYYAGIARGDLPGLRIGRVIRVPGAQLARLLEVRQSERVMPERLVEAAGGTS